MSSAASMHECSNIGRYYCFALLLDLQGYVVPADYEQKRDPYPQGILEAWGHTAHPDELPTCDAWHIPWQYPPGGTQPRGQACAWPSQLHASKPPAKGKERC